MSRAAPPAGEPRAVLVTGGAGFIGSHLVDALAARGARVRVLDDSSTGHRRNLAHHPERDESGGIEILAGDVRDLETCIAACRGVDVVYHLAAIGSVPRSLERPAETVAVNVSGFANVLAAARAGGVRRVVYASSSSVYGDSVAAVKREGEEGEPLSPYAASKRIGEDLAAVFTRCFGTRAIGLRFFNVYGPRQDPGSGYAAVIPRFFSRLLAGLPAVVEGDGRQSRDFTYVADTVAALLAAGGAPEKACARVYNVGRGRATTIARLETRIRRLVGGGPPPRFAPPRQGDVRHSLAATEAAREELGFSARIGLDRGLRKSLAHYRRAHLAAMGEPAGASAHRPSPASHPSA
jgi:nucleoside-diphosphate-sugar epimerase